MQDNDIDGSGKAASAVVTAPQTVADVLDALKPFAALADEWDRWQEKGSTSTPRMIQMSYGRVQFGLPEYQAARTALRAAATSARQGETK